MARSDSYEEIIESHLDQIESWLEQNLTDKEIAENLDVAYSTYRKYKSISVALKGRIATVKDKKNQIVEQSLYKCCNGYKYYEEVISKVKKEVLAADGVTVLNVEDIVISNVKKYKGPELAAQKYWLNNKNKVKWKDDPNKVDNDKKLIKLKEKEVNAKIIEI
ncbi:Xaa-His dipeptidase [Clostridium sp. CF012]|uniref:Xaa-His dipeptidase n=1 Tax=Clostridium sp. CF012 TaxID=2843319 RepID=UPI002815A6E3|nr:Xaa-His dipeptidase [Clostridium sp. CF012]